MRFTDKGLRSLKPADKPYWKTESGVTPDRRGLNIKVEPTGAKAFYQRYSLDGRQKKVYLGRFPELSLSDARELVGQNRKIAATGVDPRGARRRDCSAFTVRDAAIEWRNRYLKTERKALARYVSTAEKGFAPAPR